MSKEIVGMVTEEEKKRALELYERKMGLEELLVAMSDFALTEDAGNELYEKIVADTGKTIVNLQTWWDDMTRQYRWKSVDGGRWTIDFITNEIILMTE